MRIKFIILSIFSFLLLVAYGFPPLSLVVFIGSIRFSRMVSLAGSFILGVAVDLVTGREFGSHSLFYLAVSALTILYLRKVSGQNWRYLIASGVLFSLAELFIFHREFQIFAVVMSPFFVLFSAIFVGDDEKHFVLPRL